MVTVLTMYNDAARSGDGLLRTLCGGRARGNEVYIHANCHPLSFDFTLRDPYLMFSHDAFARVKTAKPEELPGIYAIRRFAVGSGKTWLTAAGILFYGDWSKVEVEEQPVSAWRAARARSARLVLRSAD